jgi:hypothetical protein
MTNTDERLEELRASGETIAKLAENPKQFAAATEAFRAEDVERFQDVLGRAGLLDRCHWICRWFCSKHCVFVCAKLAGKIEAEPVLDIDEWRAFAEFTGRLAADPDTLLKLLEIVAAEDDKAYQEFITVSKIQRFAHQLCHWLCGVHCRVACKKMCPPMPELIKVGYIPVGHFDTEGFARGPSSPGVFTPADNPPAGVGDHPFGGSVHINGLFNVAGATEYKVEVGPSATGPWTTAITTPLTDAHVVGFVWTEYTRAPTGDWYSIADMDLLSEGHTYLTDWDTPALEADDRHYVRMVVRNASLTEFASGPVPVRVDNQGPQGPVLPDHRPLIEFSQGGESLGCCAQVTKEKGPIEVHIEGTDENFSSLSVGAYGGCSGSISIFSKTYNGDRTDHGAPSPGITVTWDPWADGVEACCYVVFVRLYDRAIVNNVWNGGHTYENWRSITIG